MLPVKKISPMQGLKYLLTLFLISSAYLVFTRGIFGSNDDFENIYTKNLMVVDNLNMLYCPIRKNLNSQMVAMIARLLHGHTFDITKDISEHNKMWNWRVANQKNQTLTVSDTNQIWQNSKVLKFAIVRDPIERFLSAFLQFCHLYPQCGAQEFNRCGPDPFCILRFVDEINLSKNWSFYSEEHQMAHFAPQYQQCYFKQHWQKYKLLKYENSEKFRNTLREQLHQQGVAKEFIQTGWGVNNTVWLGELTKHETSKFFAKKRNELLTNVTLLLKAYETYREDYEFFGFPIPKLIRKLVPCKYRCWPFYKKIN